MVAEGNNEHESIQAINRQVRVDAGTRISRSGGGGGGSGRHQKVSDPALTMLTPVLNFQSLNTLCLTLWHLL